MLNKIQQRKGKEKKEKEIIASPFEKDARHLSQFLLEWILKNNPNFKYDSKAVDRWAEDVEKMLRIDKRSVEDTEAVIEFSQESNFWRSNILSGKKLREKFDTLFMQKDQPRGDSKKIFSNTMP